MPAWTRPREGWRAAHLLAVLFALAWFAGGLVILTHRVFVSNDSISNYGHVWFISREIWDGNLPFSFPEIGHGDALAFPYGFVPWVTAALVRPLFGDWVVTLWLVVGGVFTLVATWWALPETRRGPLPAATILANPILIEGIILAQLPFLWGMAFMFLAVGAWRRGWAWQAVVLMAVAQSTHAAVVLPIAGLMVLGRLPFEPRPRRLLIAYAVACVLTVPAIVLVFLSPVVGDAGLATTIGNFVTTIFIRQFVVSGPMLLAYLVLRQRRLVPVLLVVTVALNVILIPARNTSYAWGAFGREPDHLVAPLIESPAFERGAMYRVLRSRDGKVGMYQVLRAGGRLDSEFFPESFARRSWDSTTDYVAFLRGRDVDFVLLDRLYDERERTNEHTLLDQLVSEGCASRVLDEPEFDVYRVRECRLAALP